MAIMYCTIMYCGPLHIGLLHLFFFLFLFPSLVLSFCVLLNNPLKCENHHLYMIVNEKYRRVLRKKKDIHQVG